MDARRRRFLWVTVSWVLWITGDQVLSAFSHSQTVTVIEICAEFALFIFLIVLMRHEIREAAVNGPRQLKWIFAIVVWCTAGALIAFLEPLRPHGTFYLANRLLTATVGVFGLPFVVINWGPPASPRNIVKKFFIWAPTLAAIYSFFTAVYLLWGQNFLDPQFWHIHPLQLYLPSEFLLVVSFAIGALYWRRRIRSHEANRTNQQSNG